MKSTSVYVFVSFLFLSLTAQSSSAKESKPLKKKSEKIAKILAFDPLPGDTLFYGGKYFQGVANTVIGGMSLAWVISGAIEMGREDDCPEDTEGFEICFDFDELDKWVFGIGLAVYVPMLVWDGVAGYRAVKEHNRNVDASKTQVSWTPVVQATHKSALLGASIRF